MKRRALWDAGASLLVVKFDMVTDENARRLLRL